MCRSRAVLAAVAAVALVLAPGPAEAQTAQVDEAAARAQMEQRIRERLDALRGPLERARERAEREEQVREAVRAERAVTVLDTLTVGPLRVVARPERLDEARSYFEERWDEVQPMVDGAVDLSDALFLFDPAGDVGTVVLDRHQRITGRSWRNLSYERAVRENVRDAVLREVGARLPAALRSWTGNLGPRAAPDDELGNLHRRAVLVPSVAAEGCAAGRISACWAALGLNISDDPASEWYDAEQLELRRNHALHRWVRCSVGPGALCADFFDEPVRWMGAIPFSSVARADFLAFALEAGGEGSLERLLRHVPDPEWAQGEAFVLPQTDFAAGMRDALAAASGMDADELLSRWRERLAEARPDVLEGAEETRTATFLWVLLFTVFATRSSRWRLG